MRSELIGAPVPVINYLKEEHKILLRDYFEYKNYLRDCTQVARHVARLLLQLGENPCLLEVRGNNERPIFPKIFEGNVSWPIHRVCATGDTIYDPIVGKPVNAEKYKKRVFTKPVNLSDYIPREKIESHLQVLAWRDK